MKKPIIIAALMGIIASLFAAMYLSSLETTYKSGTQKVPVLIAKEYIDHGVLIDQTLVEIKEVPKDYLQPRSIQSIKDLFDKEGNKIFMTIVPIEKGEQIIMTKLHILGFDTGISAIIPKGQRAITILFDGETISGIIKPGNKVDVISVFEYENKNGILKEASKTILQNILVLSVGKNILGGAKNISNTKNQNQMLVEAPLGSLPVSFAVTVKEAEMLALASEKGPIRLSLRPMGDEDIAESDGTKMDTISNNIPSTMHIRANSQNKNQQKSQKETMEILEKYNNK
ncbi:MAG: Flp pilus assembly protein CpaB [Endomicrobiales bacterium]|nr:Flp pilus assembly protein CpaB [Endomicrobiales bacterium]